MSTCRTRTDRPQDDDLRADRLPAPRIPTERVPADPTPTAPVSTAVDAPAAPGALAVRGEIDLASARAFAALLQHHLDLAGPGGRVDLDLSRVLFFSAAGLHALLGAADAARGTGAVLRVVAASPAVEHVLALTGTRDAALTGRPAPPPTPR